jgi:UDP-GlcNAc:undecaprenyl-phosphate GlcNAc-1-phosphate transferase
MLEPFVLFIAGLIGTLALTPVVIRAAERWGALDLPNERKVHVVPTPHLGGVAIYGTFAVAAGLALLLSVRLRTSFEESMPFWLSLAAGGSLVFLLGLYDDLRHASVWMKFAVQFGAAALVMFWGDVKIEQIGNPFDGPIPLGWLWIPLTALWIVGVTNAFNLIDGLDGLAGGVSFISVLTIFVISIVSGGRSLVVLVTAALAGALLGFLRYNAHPARIFLGDCGSMFLGYLLAVLSVVGVSKRTTTLALLIPILVVGLPVFDTLYAMVRRLLVKVVKEGDWSPSAMLAMFRADKAHIHHTLMEMGYTYRKAVVVLYGLSAVFGLLALAAVLIENDRVSFGLMVVGAAAFFVMKKYSHLIPFLSRGNGGEK